MDDLANLVSQLGGATAGAGADDPGGGAERAPARRPAGGGLDGLVGKLRAAGLGDRSTPGSRPARTSRSIRSSSARRSDRTPSSGCRAGSGIDIGSLLPMLAAFLPQIIDMLTPDGKEPAGGLTGQGDARPRRPARRDARRRRRWRGAGGGRPDLDDLLGGSRRHRSGGRPERCSRRPRPGVERPAIDTRPCRDATAVGGRAPGRRRCWRHGPTPTSPPPASTGSSSRSRSCGCPRSAPTARRTSSRSGSGGTARPCSSSRSRDAQKVRNLRAHPAVDARASATPRTTSTSACSRVAPSSSTARPPSPAGGPPREVRRPARGDRPDGRRVRRDLLAGHPVVPTTTSAGTAGRPAERARRRRADGVPGRAGDRPSGTARVARRAAEPRPARARSGSLGRALPTSAPSSDRGAVGVSRRAGRRPRARRGTRPAARGGAGRRP